MVGEEVFGKNNAEGGTDLPQVNATVRSTIAICVERLSISTEWLGVGDSKTAEVDETELPRIFFYKKTWRPAQQLSAYIQCNADKDINTTQKLQISSL